MKKIILIFLIIATTQTFGEIKRNRNVLWFTPSTETRINGLATGLIINSLGKVDSSLQTEINGINLELIGIGLLIPLFPIHPLYRERASFYKNSQNVDSIVDSYNSAQYIINGISLSAGGIGGQNININGINLSGLNTWTGKVNGLSATLLLNMTGVANGVTIALYKNSSIQTNGLQIALFNTSKRLRGFQIGLWNVNEKRRLPFLNWNFD